MKAQGMEYDERMEELEHVEYPKPNAEFIYATFNAFAATTPGWARRPSAPSPWPARWSSGPSFNDYVREYGLQRSEGVLLRYLSEVYKTLVQTVPETYRDEALEDVLAFCAPRCAASTRACSTSGSACAPAMRPGLPRRGPAPPRSAPTSRARPGHRPARLRRPGPRRPPPPARCARRAHVRRGGHPLPAAARRGVDAAAPEDSMAPYWADHPPIDVTPGARRPDTTLTAEGVPRHWTARQRIIDSEVARQTGCSTAPST